MKPDYNIHKIAIACAEADTWVIAEINSRTSHPSAFLRRVISKYLGNNANSVRIGVFYDYHSSVPPGGPEDIYVEISIDKRTLHPTIVRKQVAHFPE